MDRLRKAGLAGVLGVSVVAGSAFGGGLLNAGASTPTTTAPSSGGQAVDAAQPGARGHHCRHGEGQGGPSQGSRSSSGVGSAADA
jgi:hypothetical protein